MLEVNLSSEEVEELAFGGKTEASHLLEAAESLAQGKNSYILSWSVPILSQLNLKTFSTMLSKTRLSNCLMQNMNRPQRNGFSEKI